MKTILDNSNIVESYPGITLPLTTSFIESAYHGVFKGSVLRLTKSQKIAAILDENLQHMVVNHDGRIYYNLNNWYAVISMFPFSGKVLKVWRQMLGIKQKDTVANPVNLSVFQKFRIIITILKSSHTIPSEMKQLQILFNDVSAVFYKIDLSKKTNVELTELYNGVSNKLIEKWEVTLANDMYAFIYCWLAEKRVKNSRNYISNIANLESMRPIKALTELTEQAIKNEIIEDIRVALKNNDSKSIIYANTTFANHIQKYIHNYGDRYLEELKLESPTYRTNPELLLAQIVEYSTNLESIKKYVVASESKMPKTNIIKRNYIKKARLGITNREVSRLNRSRLYGIVRSIFLQMGENLYKENIIDDPQDIFYLKIDEVFNITNINARDYINKRKKEYNIFAKLSPPPRVIINGENYEPVKSADLASEIIGVPVSSGKVEGEIIIIDDPKNAQNIKGKILVTKTTDPGWVFLLVQAAGIISEKGSLLSHTAIIARELSIPAVVGVEQATHRLKNGQRVSIDGDTGKIEILNV